MSTICIVVDDAAARMPCIVSCTGIDDAARRIWSLMVIGIVVDDAAAQRAAALSRAVRGRGRGGLCDARDGPGIVCFIFCY